jgi:hypothetical protein
MSAAERITSLEQIIKNINASDVAVYAINDYWTFDGYFSLIEKSATEDQFRINKTVFPGIELRIESAAPHRLNLHVIISNEVSSQKLRDFKSHLKLSVIEQPLSDESLTAFARELDAGKARQHGFTGNYDSDPDKLFHLGAITATVTRDSFEEALTLIPEDQRLVMIPYDCYGGMEPIPWKTQPSQDLYFMRRADIIEERSEDNIALFGNKVTPENESFIKDFLKTIGGKPKPCVSGSDGHSIQNFLNWRHDLAAKKTWIKADPTFEGLRQITFEPTARVKIQQNNPVTEYTKPFFSKITVAKTIPVFAPNPDYESVSFEVTQGLPLNSELVCIIGGRGTGKSCLVDYIGSGFGGIPRRVEYIYSADLAVVFNKDLASVVQHHAAEEAQLPFVYISQNEVKSKISQGKVGDEIKQMLGVQELTFESEVDVQISELLGNVSGIKLWFEQKNEKGEVINDKAETQKQLSRVESLLESITTKENKEKLERFTENVKKVALLKEKIKKLTALSTALESFQAKTNTEAASIDGKIPLIDLTLQINAIAILAQEATAEIGKCDLDNEKTRADFAKVYTGDLSGLLQNAESYRNSIEKLKSRQTEIGKKEIELAAAKKARRRIPALILRELLRQKREIDQRWQIVRMGAPSGERSSAH